MGTFHDRRCPVHMDYGSQRRPRHLRQLSGHSSTVRILSAWEYMNHLLVVQVFVRIPIGLRRVSSQWNVWPALLASVFLIP